MFEKDEFTLDTQISDEVMDRIEALLNTDNSERFAEIGRSLSLD